MASHYKKFALTLSINAVLMFFITYLSAEARP